MSNVWILLLIACVIVALGGMLNLISEDSPVIALAATEACGNPFCARKGQTETHRSVLDETVVFALPSGSVTVICKKEYVFFGATTCEKQP
jgi:hypothetical protein